MPSSTIRTAEATRKTIIYIAIGVVTLIILLVTLATAGKEKIFRCERLATGEVDCVMKESILGLITLSSRTTAGVQAISLGQQCVDVECKYRLEMYATQGIVPVDEKYTTNFDQLKNIKNEVNSFFTNKDSSYVQVKQETNPVLMTAVVVVFLLIWAYLGYLTWRAQHPSPEEIAVQS